MYKEPQWSIVISSNAFLISSCQSKTIASANKKQLNWAQLE